MPRTHAQKAREAVLRQRTPKQVPIGTTITLTLTDNGWLSHLIQSDGIRLGGKSLNLLKALAKVITPCLPDTKQTPLVISSPPSLTMTPSVPNLSPTS